jgi:hypothetical protein
MHGSAIAVRDALAGLTSNLFGLPMELEQTMKITLYRIAADVEGWRVGLNRVCGQIIGVYANLGTRCLSFVWRQAR